MRLQTERLVIAELSPDMASVLSRGSLDEATRKFLPDEVFETEDIAAQVISNLIACYAGDEGPYVYAVLRQDGTFVGYVQLVPLERGWEIGYHVSAEHRGQGYATEAVTAFLPVMMRRVGIDEVAGICDAENTASVRVLEKCSFRRAFAGDGMYQGTVRPLVRMVYP